MVKEKVTIYNPSGLHLRPAGLLCNEAIKYASTVRFVSGNATINAKSLLSVLGACVKCGDVIELVCDGPDEKEALQSIISLIDGGLGE